MGDSEISNCIVATNHSPDFLPVVPVQTFKKQRKDIKCAERKKEMKGNFLFVLSCCVYVNKSAPIKLAYTICYKSPTSVQVNETKRFLPVCSINLRQNFMPMAVLCVDPDDDTSFEVN